MSEQFVLETEKLNLWYGDKQALIDINMNIPRNSVTALIGPSGCGKSTLIRCFDRMNDIIDNCRTEGKILLDGSDINARNVDVVALRKKVGMVFQKPNPFPKSVYENVVYGPKVHGVSTLSDLDKIAERSLKDAWLWDEVKDRIEDPAMCLSGGQQQRLCIARALAVEPEIILMDEPCSALDPIATEKIERLIEDLQKKYTVVIVTHNMQQAARVSDYTGYLYLGKLIEFGSTKQIFENPKEELTEKYITGRFG